MPTISESAAGTLLNRIEEVGNVLLRNERVIMFVDQSNLFHAARKQNNDQGERFRLDYNKLSILAKNRFLMRKMLYYSDYAEHNLSTMPPEVVRKKKDRDNFYACLKANGFQLTKLDLVVDEKVITEKGLNGRIIADMRNIARTMPRCDTFILVAGNDCYAETLKEVMTNFGVRTEVAFFATDAGRLLKETANSFVDLTTLKRNLEREDSNNRSFTEE